MTKTRKIIYVGVFAAVAVLLVLGVFFDKSIANAMYQPENIMAIIMECAGIFPPFIFVSSAFIVLFLLIKQEDKRRILKKTLCGVAVVVSYFLFGYFATEQLFTSVVPRLLVGVGSAVLFSPITYLVFRNSSEERLKRLAIFLVFAALVSVISSLISVNVIKYIWGRPRYREMMAAGDYDLAAFTPWYQVNGFILHGHHSFPSGHTCSATNLLVLCALGEVFPEAEEKKGTIAFICVVYIFAMAYSRMVLGAHFLSDVTGGFLVGFVTYAVTRYIYFDKSSLVIKAIMDANQTALMNAQENGGEEPPAQEDAAPAESVDEPILYVQGQDDAPMDEEPKDEQ